MRNIPCFLVNRLRMAWSARALALIVVGAVATIAMNQSTAATSPTRPLQQPQRTLVAQVVIGEAFVGGRTRDTSPVTITVRSAGGVQKGFGWGHPDESGAFQIPVESIREEQNPAAAIVTGDEIELEKIVGDPFTLIVPPLSTQYNPETGVIRGTTLANVKVAALDDIPDGLIVASTTSDEKGYFELTPPSGLADELPCGWIRVIDNKENEIFAAWSATSVDVGVDDNYVIVHGPRRHTIRIELAGKEVGQLVSSASQQTRAAHAFDEIEPSSYHLLFFEDAFGDEVLIRAGDTLAVYENDEFSVSLDVLPISVVINATEQLMVIETIPRARLKAFLFDSFSGITNEYSAISNADGRSLILLNENSVTMSYNSGGRVTLLYGLHRISVNVVSTGLTVDLDKSTVSGVWRPGEIVTGRLERNGGVLREAAVSADHRGDYELRFLQNLGSDTFPILPADILSMTLRSPTGNENFSLLIPQFTLELDIQDLTIRGMAQPGSVVKLEFASSFTEVTPRPSKVEIAVGDSGNYVARIEEGFGLRPGVVVKARAVLPSGHVVVRTAIRPQIAIQHGGSLVCGNVTPTSVVHVEVIRSGARYAWSESVSDALGKFYMELEANDGAPRLEEGDEVVLTVAGATTGRIAYLVPRLVASNDWITGQFRLHGGPGQPGQSYEITGVPSTCRQGRIRGISSSGKYIRHADADGYLEITDQFFVRPAWSAIEVVPRFFGEVRVFKVLQNPGIEINRDRARLVGVVNPSSAITVEVADRASNAGDPLSSHSDTHGFLDLTLPDSTWVIDDEGGEVRIDVDSSTSTRVEIGKTSFDYDSDGVIGVTDYGAKILLRFEFPDGSRKETELTLNEGGTFHFSKSMVPTRSNWNLDDVKRLEIVVVTQLGHRVVSEVIAIPDPMFSLFLPVLIDD